MSELIQISDGCYIDPDLVAEVKVNQHADCINLRMHDGVGHNLKADYGLSIYTTHRALIERINAARAK